MDFAKRHWVTIFGHTGVCLDIFRQRYCQKSIDDAVEYAETYVSLSLLEGSPAKFFQHCCKTRPSADQLGPYKGVVGSLSYFGQFGTNVSSYMYKSESTVHVYSDPVYA